MPSVSIRRTSPPIRGRLHRQAGHKPRSDAQPVMRFTTGRLLKAPRRKAEETPESATVLPALDDRAIAALSAPEVLAQLIVARRDLDRVMAAVSELEAKTEDVATVEGVIAATRYVGDVLQKRIARLEARPAPRRPA